ncbi:MAG: T9SS type A sorting domain-containing protein [Flavobacteriales bacterium]|nr:T9SS type A sorting domain-containing protein [Flavobacteriales bacterium]
MKKIYFGAIASIFSVGVTTAQVIERPYSFDEIKVEAAQPAPSATYTATSKALGTTFWTEDFTGGAGSWVIDNGSQAGGAFGWSVDAVSDGWYFNGINSTSGGNFAELSNGDASQGTQSIGETFTLTSAAIDIQTLAGTDDITLSFEETGARFYDLQEVQVSTDGTVFTTVRDNQGYTRLTSTGGSAYADPETVSVNIAPYIVGATTLYIRFSWTSEFSSSASANAWVTYGWYIDDVALTTNADNDIVAESSFWGTAGLNYSQIPASQQTAIDFTTNARNAGINTQTEVQLNVDITGPTTYNASSPAGVSIAAVDYDSLIVAPFTPNGVGTYNITWGLSQNEVDDIPSNNDNESITFEVTDYVYARDKGTQEAVFSNGGDGFVLGSYYDIFTDDVMYSVDVKIASTAVVGSTVTGRVYSLDPNATTLASALVLEDQSFEYTLTSSDIGQIINLDLATNGNAGFPVFAGETYFVAVGSDGDGGTTSGATIGLTNFPIEQTCFMYNAPDDTWYLAPGTPMVRMNLDPASNNVGLEEQSLLFGAEVYPNPATDNASVRYIMGAASDVTIEVKDITGKVVASFNEGTKAEGSHVLNVNTAAFAEGVYYVTIESGKSLVTKKLVKK